ncbi:MAG: heparin lyase I family protein [Dermatophilus congolensis]|nr:heparin lyase I family protein [Dermatophilus congolensis]
MTPPADASLTPLHAGNKEGQYGAALPSTSQGEVVARIPRGAPAAPRYRSEVYWENAQGQEIRVGEGDRLRCRMTLTPELGASADDATQWQVVWQLHGPEKNGEWPQPPLNLHVRGGTWRIGGGAGRADGGEAYAEPFTPYVDGRKVTWSFDILVSSDPSRARVDAWLDDAHVVDGWHPPSGTRYPQHDYLTVKAGLYAGVESDRRRQTETREVTVEAMRCAVDASPTATATP